MSERDLDARVVRVELGERGYGVRIGRGLLDRLPDALREAVGALPRQAHLVVDANVRAHAARCAGALRRAGVAVSETEIVASEKAKTLDTLGSVLVGMAEARLERGGVVVAVGGGITGDVAGFGAACYRRGVALVQCPTTLLAMVDASVGGKTGVNLRAGGVLQKNMVGAFHQPVLVAADTTTLDTLPDREFRAGLAECVKHGVIGGCAGDREHFGWIRAGLDRVLARDAGALTELIERSVRFKAAVVAGDEREELGGDEPGRPSRALLNLGHTFGHVIETLPGAVGIVEGSGRSDPPLLHGEAVALGMVAAAETGAELALCPPDLVEEIRTIVARCGLPTRCDGLPTAAELIKLMGTDKKIAAGRVRLVLPTPGQCARVVSDAPPEAVAVGWRAIGAR
ncbi:MAG TPA: 3-dehydroquinate synthase family protein [Phycisphaerales bacterium]|nr:3-dehydroquinate synthase family protein [Phycisphaerales bacterium]